MTTTPDQIVSGAETRSSPPVARHPGPHLGGVALIVGSVLTAIGMALHLPSMPEEAELVSAIAEDLSQWLASHLLQSFGLAFVAVGVATAVRLASGRGGILTMVGALATSFGALVTALSDMAHGAVSFAVVEQVDPATSLAIHEAYFSHPATLALNAGTLVLTLGMLVLGAGLLRSRVAPRWAGIVILLTPIAIQASFALGLPTYLRGLPFVIGMTTLAYVASSGQVTGRASTMDENTSR